jgi:hypothetical protein
LDEIGDYGVYPDSTLYMRFKRELHRDDEGQEVHLDYHLSKFKDEFDV